MSLKITFRSGRAELARIKEVLPSARTRAGACEVVIRSEQPAEVAERGRVVLEKIRTAS